MHGDGTIGTDSDNAAVGDNAEVGVLDDVHGSTKSMADTIWPVVTGIRVPCKRLGKRVELCGGEPVAVKIQ